MKPFVVFNPPPRGTKDSVTTYSGLCFEIFNTLQKEFNFTYYCKRFVSLVSMLDLFLPIFCFTLESYTVLLPEDNSYGVYSRNNWDGIMGMVINEVNLKFFLCFD